MLFDVQTIKGEQCAQAIAGAILAKDPTAQVSVRVADRRVRVEGLLTEQQALDALTGAGFAATKAPPHSGEGRTCCGGCG